MMSKVDRSKLSLADRESTTLHGLFRAPTLRKPCNVSKFPDHLAVKAALEMPARDWVVRNLATGRIVRRGGMHAAKPHVVWRYGKWAVYKNQWDAMMWPWPSGTGNTVSEACAAFTLKERS